MISIRPITGTGEKKCRPMKRSGRSVAVASPVMLMLLVLLAKMVSGSACWLMASHVSRLSASSSKIASITMSWPGPPSVPAAVLTRAERLVRGRLLELALLHLALQVPADPLLPVLGQLGGTVGERHAACPRPR